MDSPSATSTNYKGCSLFITIQNKTKYSDLSKTQSRAVRRASDVIKLQIKLVANKTWYSVILEYICISNGYNYYLLHTVNNNAS